VLATCGAGAAHLLPIHVISHETIEAVRHQVSIVSVIGDRVRLERRGQSHIGLCPFHKEKTPSFHVNAERGFFYCFGCQAGGNAISFLQQLDGLTFPEAVRELAERAGIEVQETGSLVDRKQEGEARRRRDELYTAGTLAAEFFERCLKEHPLGGYARAELRRRKLQPEFADGAAAALAAFRVGYAPYGWDGLTRHLREAGFNLRAAEAVGLIGERKSGDGHYDRFRHRLMFAVMDLQGRVIAFSGRALEEPAPDELARLGVAAARVVPGKPVEPPAKYYNSPESPIYRKREAVFGLFQARQAIRQLDRCVVVEGNFDVVSLHARGIQHVVAPLGTAFTPEQAGLIKRYTANATFLFDGDAAGQRATQAAREPCQKEGLLARVARLPKGVDPDDLIREGGREAIDRVLNGSQALLEYLIDMALQSGFSTDDAVARAAKMRQIGELIGAETDPAVRSMAERHADEVAGRLGILSGEDGRSFRAVRSAVLDAARGQADPERSPVAAPPERARSPSRVEEIRHQIFGAALEYPELLADPAVLDLLEPVDGDLALGLTMIGALAARGAGGLAAATADPAAFVAQFPESLRRHVSIRLAVPEFESAATAQAVLVDNLLKLARLHQRRERASVVEELRRAAASGDLDTELSLLQRQLTRAKARHKLV
jgi:DNA primase